MRRWPAASAALRVCAMRPAPCIDGFPTSGYHSRAERDVHKSRTVAPYKFPPHGPRVQTTCIACLMSLVRVSLVLPVLLPGTCGGSAFVSFEAPTLVGSNRHLPFFNSSNYPHFFFPSVSVRTTRGVGVAQHVTIANDGPVCPPPGEPGTKCSETLVTRDAGRTYVLEASNGHDTSGNFNSLGDLGQRVPPRMNSRAQGNGSFTTLTGNNGGNWLDGKSVSQLQHWADTGNALRIVQNQTVTFEGYPGGESQMGQSGQIARLPTGELIAAFYGYAPPPPPPPLANECGAGLPENLTPLMLLSCADQQNRSQMFFNSSDSSVRLTTCPSHALCVDCRPAGGMEDCGKLAKAEPLVFSGPLSNHNAPDDPENFGFRCTKANGSSVISFMSGRPPSAMEDKCVTGVGEGQQVMLAPCVDGALTQRWRRTSLGQWMCESGAERLQLCLSWSPTAPSPTPRGRYYTIYYFSSKDDGLSWQWMSRIDQTATMPIDVEGPCEPTLVTLNDGRLLTLFREMRRPPARNLWKAYSNDGAKTWTGLSMTPAWSVWPQLVLMSSGVLALTSGRPGIGLVRKFQATSILIAHQ